MKRMCFHGNKGREYLERRTVKNVTGNLEGRRKCLPEGPVPKPLNGPIEAQGKMTMGLLGPLGWSTEVRGLGLSRQCWLRGQTLTSRAGSQRL